jgi:hypothetical protein
MDNPRSLQAGYEAAGWSDTFDGRLARGTSGALRRPREPPNPSLGVPRFHLPAAASRGPELAQRETAQVTGEPSSSARYEKK